MSIPKIFFIAVLSLVFLHFPLGGHSLPTACNQTTTFQSPCAQISHLFSQKNLTVVPAELAYNCLKSVPLHLTEAKQLHGSLVPYLKWQSTFSYVEDPPVGYQMPAYDFWSAFETIGMKLSKSAYENEWEFGMDLFRTVGNAHDNHFGYILDIIGKVFAFGRNLSLVSVSKDGYALPEVYVHHDIQRWYHHNASFPTAVVAIDGHAVGSYLENWMNVSWRQDPDAFYNSLFWSAAHNTLVPDGGEQVKGAFGGSGIGQFFYQGPSTSLLFANGTTTTYTNFAKVQVDFTGIDDGESFYDKFCTGNEQRSLSTNDNETTSTNSSSTTPEPPFILAATPGYPLPIIRHPQNIIAGYYLDSSYHDQVATLSISNFVNINGALPQIDFQRTTQEFLRLAKSDGKTQLILDLRGNKGGTILQAFDVFKQLFPHLEPWAASRFRAFDTINAVGEQVSLLSGSNYNGLNTTFTYEKAADYEPYNYRLNLDSQSRNLPNWSALFGPSSISGRDNFTNLIRYNLSSPVYSYVLGIKITGYPPKSPVPPPPFQPSNIIMLHDGFCASTCALLSDLLRTQAGIRSIVMGGRPQHGPMQAVGGTRGMELYGFDYIYELMQLAWNSGSEEQRAAWNVSALDLGRVSPEPMRRWASHGWGSVNVRDSILQENAETDGVPSHFLWIPADCRLWYTGEMIEDVTALWKKVAQLAWGAGGREKEGGCVFGGL